MENVEAMEADEQARVTYYVASSVDGYIAREDGNVSWLEELNIPPEQTGFREFFETVDAVVMGRKTHDFILNYGKWPYGDRPAWICSSAEVQPLEGCKLQAARTPKAVIAEAKALGIKHLWLVGGGKLAAAFLQEKLISNINISQMPIVLGGGIPLFGQLDTNELLEIQSAEQRDCGFVQLEFLPKNRHLP